MIKAAACSRGSRKSSPRLFGAELWEVLNILRFILRKFLIIDQSSTWSENWARLGTLFRRRLIAFALSNQQAWVIFVVEDQVHWVGRTAMDRISGSSEIPTPVPSSRLETWTSCRWNMEIFLSSWSDDFSAIAWRRITPLSPFTAHPEFEFSKNGSRKRSGIQVDRTQGTSLWISDIRSKSCLDDYTRLFHFSQWFASQVSIIRSMDSTGLLRVTDLIFALTLYNFLSLSSPKNGCIPYTQRTLSLSYDQNSSIELKTVGKDLQLPNYPFVTFICPRKLFVCDKCSLFASSVVGFLTSNLARENVFIASVWHSSCIPSSAHTTLTNWKVFVSVEPI